MFHTPVLWTQVSSFLNLVPNGVYIDCTLGDGGYTQEIISSKDFNGHVYALETDRSMLLRAEERLKDQSHHWTGIWSNFKDLHYVLQTQKVQKCSGVIADLGVASHHFDTATRGFSYQHEGPLDMRLDPQTTSLTAQKIINQYSLTELKTIFKTYGQERLAHLIAKAILYRREKNPYQTTSDLSQTVATVYRKYYSKKSLKHPAKKVFQALRVYINQEWKHLIDMLCDSLEVTLKNGRIIIISYHSQEDRIVKNIFRHANKVKLGKIITPKPIQPTPLEYQSNPRSKSALLRVFERSDTPYLKKDFRNQIQTLLNLPS